ncbi:acetyl-CoA carboxylase biotin carboxyl carrier protein [Paraburkholderia sp. Ac-20347]|uniref:acetyl-CoA carboxylase biotin carboxyl carrier protein n=1 Tax=Paraburkholderia sp. Ac-20347 TaxID=2703892 RepID=UPI001981A72A|nr:acetyl-CoA carboxylase biotin carboxyl carrier protein [Paraburkholderia sp. Ac-20347]MBN3807677.1 acetyl-CoA carboxylase biotin carboxyl carrier protein [Paraburkholderia sp. Ac-20347]
MEIQKITHLMDLLSRSDLTELHLQEGNDVLKLVRGGALDSPPPKPLAHTIAQPIAQQGSAVKPADQATAAPAADTRHVFKSPMVGTFFRAGSPGAAPFVETGTQVAPGQTLGVIEAMKMLTEIECDVGGKVLEILVENGAFVEFGHPLFTIETRAPQ